MCSRFFGGLRDRLVACFFLFRSLLLAPSPGGVWPPCLVCFSTSCLVPGFLIRYISGRLCALWWLARRPFARLFAAFSPFPVLRPAAELVASVCFGALFLPSSCSFFSFLFAFVGLPCTELRFDSRSCPYCALRPKKKKILGCSEGDPGVILG